MPVTEKEKMLAGELYLASDPELVAERAAARRLLRAFNATTEDEPERRRALLVELLGALGPDAWIEPPFRCDYGRHLSIGARSYLNFDCIVLDCSRVTIGRDVFFGPGVHLYAATHPLEANERIKGPELARPVTISDKVWVGGGSIICPGVTIGEGTTVGAGSVVVRDLPPNVLAVGNPCRIVRLLER